ncbi:WD40 repeat domain-containing serine/threonine protein kinase [Actinocorallia populi]|uniref:WD40 repeat domain-containing serine/threonine protein kinase n=1 Tax=Actinocorallia populi TaxID=2079200 RepID=UPI000D094C97|nr:serine/threonine-protein kinase [Actinocorallia populi]
MEAKTGALVLGRYLLVELLGAGGMGTAWKARDERLQRNVALKQLKIPAGTDAVARRHVARMEREARAAAMLQHPGIITVHDQFLDEDGLPWIVMEFVPGRSLGQLIRDEGRLRPGRAAAIGAQVASALAAAHAAGIVHRDVKPANILLDGERAVLTDFGIAALDGATTTLTPTGVIIGTPAYMAPEQLNGQEAAPACDLWALGATLYHAVEGRPAFSAPTMAAMLLAVSRGEPRPMVHAGPLQPLLYGLLTKDPSLRPTADQAATRLLAPPPPPDTLPNAVPLIPASTATIATPARQEPPAPSRRKVLLGLGAAAGTLVALPATYYAAEQLKGTDDGGYLEKSTESVTAKLIGKLPHKYPVFAVAFSPDSRLLATGSGTNAGQAQIWDLETRDQRGKNLKHNGAVRAVAFSPDPDSLLLATGGIESPLTLWDATTGAILHAAADFESTYSLAFNRTGDLVAVGGDSTVRLWEVESFIEDGEALDHGERVYALAFSPDGVLASGVSEGSEESGWGQLWDVDDHSAEGPRLDHDGMVAEVAFTPDGTLLATAGFDNAVRLWGVTGHRASASGPAIPHPAAVSALAFNPVIALMATGCFDGKVRLWDVVTRTERTALDHGSAEVYAAAFSPDGKTLAVGTEDKSVWLWQILW